MANKSTSKDILPIHELPNDVEVIDSNEEIKISNTIIQAYSELSSDAQKILFLTLSKLRYKTVVLNMLEPIYFNISDYLKTTHNRIGGSQYVALKKALNELKHYDITPVGNLNDDKTYYSFPCASLVFMDREKGLFGVELNHHFQKFLFGEDGTGLKGDFTLMLLRNYLRLNDVTAMKVYGLLYEGYNKTANKALKYGSRNGNEITFAIPVEQLRNTLLGENSTKYQDFRIFKRDIISRSIKAINEKTEDMRVEIKELKRTGRKVTSIMFNVCLNEKIANENFRIARLYTDMYKIANDPSLQLTKGKDIEFRTTFGDVAYAKWLIVYAKKRAKNNNTMKLTAFNTREWLEKHDVVNEDKVNETIKKMKKKTASEIGLFASKLKNDNYIKIKGFWKDKTSESIYNKLLAMKKAKQEAQTAIKEEYKEQRMLKTDEVAKEVEIDAELAKINKEISEALKNEQAIQ